MNSRVRTAALDEFTQKRLRDGLADRYQSIRKLGERAATATRMGALILEFSNDEISVLFRAGFLTYGDIDLLRSLGFLCEADHQGLPCIQRVCGRDESSA